MGHLQMSLHTLLPKDYLYGKGPNWSQLPELGKFTRTCIKSISQVDRLKWFPFNGASSGIRYLQGPLASSNTKGKVAFLLQLSARDNLIGVVPSLLC